MSAEAWRMTSLTPLMFRSLVRLLTSLIAEPAASIATLLYYSDLLPQNIIWEGMDDITSKAIGQLPGF
ncbi:hypothetical protein SCA6_011653 [Theobroma cacao]